MSTSTIHIAAKGTSHPRNNSGSYKNSKSYKNPPSRKHKAVDLFVNSSASISSSSKEKQETPTKEKQETPTKEQETPTKEKQERPTKEKQRTRVKKVEDPELKKKVAPMLGLDPEGSWNVVSTLEGLAMIHADPEADLQYYRYLRGVVVDLATGQMVCSSYPTTPSFTLFSLSQPSQQNNKLKLSEDLEIDLTKFRFKIGFEGTLIHVFKVNGKVYRVTRKRLDPSRSKWGNSKNFSEMYWDLNGPADEVLFSPDKDYSPFCHSFIMVHPDVMIASRETHSFDTNETEKGKGYLVYLGMKQMYSPQNCFYPFEKVDYTLKLPELTTVHPSLFRHDETISRDGKTENTKIFCPENLTLQEANKHLMFGLYAPFEGYEALDPRLLPGEFIIMENTETGELYRIESIAYSWRYKIRNNNPNLLHRFYELLDFAYLKNNSQDNLKYTEMFPLLTKYSQSEINKWFDSSHVVLWPQETERIHEVPKTRDDKLYNIWMCMLCAVPVRQQREVLSFYEIFLARREQLINWFISLSSKYKNENLSLSDLKERVEKEILPSGIGYSRRAKDILVKTRQFAEERVARGDNVDPVTRESKTVEQLTHENIRNFLGKEVGASLYRLLKEMDLYHSPPVVPKMM